MLFLNHLQLRKYFWLLFSVLTIEASAQDQGFRLIKQIDIPPSFLQSQEDLMFGGDLRIGDLENKGEVAFIIYRTANSVDGGASQPSFLGAFRLNGDTLWQKGKGEKQPNRPGPVAIHDIDGDGETEVICLFATDATKVEPFSMKHMSLQILDGKTGKIEVQHTSEELSAAKGKGPSWVHQRILLANLLGNQHPREFIIKLGKTIFAFNHQLEIIWTYFNPNDTYQNCPAYIPSVGDIDNDGKDEINGGYYLLDDDGSVLWEKKLGRNMDCVLIDFWDNDSTKRAICSGFGFVMNAKGDTILHIGESYIPHGQELRIGNFDYKSPGREMAVRYNGHKPDIRIFNQEGSIIQEFKLNDSPNHTGMEVIHQSKADQVDFIYNGGAIWNGQGKMIAQFQELASPPVGNFRQGWYHCIPTDLTGDEAEEIILYNPWDRNIFIYGAIKSGWNQFKPYRATARQYNVRLMD